MKTLLLLGMIIGSTCFAEYYNAYGSPGYYQQQQLQVQQQQLDEMRRANQQMQMQNFQNWSDQQNSQPSWGSQFGQQLNGLANSIQRARINEEQNGN